MSRFMQRLVDMTNCDLDFWVIFQVNGTSWRCLETHRRTFRQRSGSKLAMARANGVDFMVPNEPLAAVIDTVRRSTRVTTILYSAKLKI